MLCILNLGENVSLLFFVVSLKAYSCQYVGKLVGFFSSFLELKGIVMTELQHPADSSGTLAFSAASN